MSSSAEEFDLHNISDSDSDGYVPEKKVSHASTCFKYTSNQRVCRHLPKAKPPQRKNLPLQAPNRSLQPGRKLPQRRLRVTMMTTTTWTQIPRTFRKRVLLRRNQPQYLQERRRPPLRHTPKYVLPQLAHFYRTDAGCLQLSQLEHILLRPDSYIGSVETITQVMWTYDSDTKRMVLREVKYVPGFFKIVDEILVNAADNKVNGL